MGSYDLSDNGFLLDPNSESAKYRNSDAITFDKIKNIQCLVLLGEPGIGKTTAIKSEIERFQKSKENIFFSKNLNQYGDESRFINEIFNNDTINQWKQDKSILHLYLDSFDECLISISKLTNIFQSQLDKLKDYSERLNLVISCRTGDWPESLITFLTDLFGENNVGVFELLPLRRKDISIAAEDNGIESDRFISDIISKEIQPLAIIPLTLNFLLSVFKKNGAFPKSKEQLYYDGCIILCEEPNPERIPKSILKNQLSAERRLIIAARIASIMAFCNKTSILIEGTTSHDRNILHISEVGESVMKSQVGDFNFTREHVKETITQTSIFNSRGSNLFGFSHFAISEYLAAKYLIWNMLPTEKLKSLTTISTDSECKTIPQIKNTTAWLSTLSKDFFLLSVKNDPQNILIGDIGNMEDELKFKLVEALIKQLDKQLINDADWSLSSHYRKLKHPLLHEQLNPIISNKHAYYLTRRVSISIAGACTVYDSINALQKVVFDEMDNIHIRTSAASALAAYGLPEILKILKPLAIKYQRSDTDDGLKGIALSALWPNYLSSKELFSSITIPRRENFTGSYAMFLYHLYNNFQSEYVEDGLYWLSTFNINNREIQYKFERLVNLILYQAWNNIAKISNLEVFSKVIAKRLLNHENIFPLSNDYKAQPYKYNIDVDNRFKIVRLLLKRIEPDKVHLLTNIGNHELVNDNEFVVVFNLFLAEDDLEMKNNWAELLKYLFIWNVTNISLIAENIDKYTELEKAFGSRFKTIELDSEEAVNQKVIFDENLKREKEREKRRNKRNTKKVDVQQILKSDLKHFEETNDNKWWYKLFLNLTLEDNGYYKEDEHKAIVEELSGWQYIDEDIEKRFIKSGKNYILNFSENSKKWLGKDIMYRPAISGYKTLLYLLKKDPQFISNLEPEHWQNWMYIMLTYLEPYSSGEDKTYLELLNQAYENAPNYFLIAFEKVALLQCKEESASFNVIEKVNLFFDKKIESVLLKILQKHDLNIAAKSYLLGVLLERNNIVAYKITKEIALQKDSSSEILAITSVFINYCTTKDWEIIKNKITTNVQFGKELFLSYPEQRQYNSNKPLYARLTEIQLAELYIWLANHFPKEKYPDTSGLHKPDKNGYVWQIRASLISSLELKGSAASIEALKYISTKVSNVDFSYNRILANASYRKNNWNPLEAKELIQYIDKANSKVIQNEDDLIKLLIESLNRASIVLQGANPMSFSLWDENKPKNEEALSAYLNNFRAA